MHVATTTFPGLSHVYFSFGSVPEISGNLVSVQKCWWVSGGQDATVETAEGNFIGYPDQGERTWSHPKMR
jgi:hypothetical protein